MTLNVPKLRVDTEMTPPNDDDEITQEKEEQDADWCDKERDKRKLENW